MSQYQVEKTGSEILLPSPPEIVQELRSISADVSSLGSIIAKGSELAQEALERINSPYFSLAREISSIDKVVPA
jgi:HD-like signal output (HDOD) protein